jgi:serine protease Do
MRNYPRLVLALLIGLSIRTPLHAESRPLALDKRLPETVQDLRDIQERVKKVAAKVIPCTVGIIIERDPERDRESDRRAGRRVTSAGSGVIVRKDGYVLTAGHVSGKPGRPVTVILADGRRVKGKTLGRNKDLDSGMIRITDEGEWPFVEMGDVSKLKQSTWCLALGHPEGWRRGRPPVLRLGRVLARSDTILRTDCPLVGGDSGGPLFDLDGKIIGIHSKISNSLTDNFHVPVDTYRLTWDRLVNGEVWGGGKGPVYLGLVPDDDARECRIAEVEKNSPAEKAGLKANDVVLRFGKYTVEDSTDLRTFIAERQPGDEVSIRVRRGKKILDFTVTIGKHSD